MAEGIDRMQKALIGINCFYVIIGLVLICISALALHAVQLVITPVVGGLIFCGALLILVAVLGIVASVNSHQGLLFALQVYPPEVKQVIKQDLAKKSKGSYLSLLTLTFIIQYCVSIACLVVMGEARRHNMLIQGWLEASNQTKQDIQQEFDCCGLDELHIDAALCQQQSDELKCCIPTLRMCSSCRHCYDPLDTRLREAVRYTGGAGLIFGFLEMAGIILGWCYRKQPSWAFAHTVLN